METLYKYLLLTLFTGIYGPFKVVSFLLMNLYGLGSTYGDLFSFDSFHVIDRNQFAR